MKKVFSKITIFLLLISLLLPLLPGEVSASYEIKLTILHTNDLHGKMLPFEENGKSLGGFARLSTLISEIKMKEENVILIDVGDTIEEDHNLLANYFRGKPVVEFMNTVGYNIMIPGNHDFEFGLDVLAEVVEESNFDILMANIIQSEKSTPVASKLISLKKDYKIIDVNGIKVAIIGITLPLHGFKGIEIENPLRTAELFIPELRNKSDLVILATHHDISVDLDIIKKVNGIDIVLAAHEHAIFYPHGLWKGNTLIAKTSCWGKQLGRIDVTFEKQDKQITIKNIKARIYEIDSSIPEDEKIVNILKPYVNQVNRYRLYLIIGIILMIIFIGIALFLLGKRFYEI